MEAANTTTPIQLHQLQLTKLQQSANNLATGSESAPDLDFNNSDEEEFNCNENDHYQNRRKLKIVTQNDSFEHIIVRSRTSFSLSPIVHASTKSILKQLGASKLTALSSTPTCSVTSTAPTASAVPSSAPSKTDGFLNEIDKLGFAGVWNSPVARCYFFMFLYSLNQQNLFYFRMDSSAYRQQFPTLSASGRKNLANKIYTSYFSKNASLPIGSRWKSVQSKRMLYQLVTQLESFSRTLFEDLSFLAVCLLEQLFNGEEIDEVTVEGLGMSDTASIDSSATKERPAIKLTAFKDSPFYKLMWNDLRGVSVLTGRQFQRSIERVADLIYMRPMDDKDEFDKFSTFFKSMMVRVDSDGLQRLKSLAVTRDITPVKNFVRMESMSSRSFPSLASSTMSLAQQKKTNAEAYSQSTGSIDNLKVTDSEELVEHTFIPFSGTGTEIDFCELCFRKLIITSERTEEGNAPHRCDRCGYACHKSCRQYAGVQCVQSDDNVNNFDAAKITERMDGLQKTIEIETKIRDGLERIQKAKAVLNGMSNNNGGGEDDIDAQMRRSNQKLEVLNRELQKCKLQFEAVNQRHTSPQTPPLESIRVQYYDEKTNSQLVQFVEVPKGTIVQQVVKLIQEKLLLPVISEKWQLSYAIEGVDIELRNNDILDQMNIDFHSTTFLLRPVNQGNSADLISDDDGGMGRKVKEVLFEIIETENDYVNDLKVIRDHFITPMETSDFKKHTQDIFSNIEELIGLHTRSSALLNEKRESFVSQPTFCEQVISVFQEMCNDLSVYSTYCSNQNHARRCLNDLKEESAFTKFLSSCESSPSLRRLKIEDFLVKPMHRVTRYPILLKRLLGYMTNRPESSALTETINRIESIIKQVNEAVREKDLAWRMQYLENNIDFNGQSDKFKLMNGRRELVLEKSFSLLPRKSNTAVDVVLVLFNDMIMITRQKKDHVVLHKPPIPLEAAVFIDQSDNHQSVSGFTNVFRILHMEQEMYTFQAMSNTDKQQFLEEADILRLHFSFSHFSVEIKYLKERVEANQNNFGAINSALDSSPPNTSSFSPSVRKHRRIVSIQPMTTTASPLSLENSADSSKLVSSFATIRRTASMNEIGKNGSQRGGVGGSIDDITDRRASITRLFFNKRSQPSARSTSSRSRAGSVESMSSFGGIGELTPVLSARPETDIDEFLLQNDVKSHAVDASEAMFGTSSNETDNNDTTLGQGDIDSVLSELPELTKHLTSLTNLSIHKDNAAESQLSPDITDILASSN